MLPSSAFATGNGKNAMELRVLSLIVATLLLVPDIASLYYSTQARESVKDLIDELEGLDCIGTSCPCNFEVLKDKYHLERTQMVAHVSQVGAILAITASGISFPASIYDGIVGLSISLLGGSLFGLINMVGAILADNSGTPDFDDLQPLISYEEKKGLADQQAETERELRQGKISGIVNFVSPFGVGLLASCLLCILDR